jgi:hypothetical protein
MNIAEIRTMPACGNPLCRVSTGIHGGLTFGSGRLDARGYWSDPCRTCAAAQDASIRERSAEIGRSLASGGMAPRDVRRYIKKQDWLWLPAWPPAEAEAVEVRSTHHFPVTG